MSIVVITIPGESKKAFVNELHDKTAGGVDLVIIQKRKDLPLLKKLIRIYKVYGLSAFFKECYYAVLLRIRGDVRNTLELFRATHKIFPVEDYKPKTLVVSSVNSKEVEDALATLNPTLVVVWGTGILEPHIMRKAKTMINLHFGLAPYYRGAVANQFAVLNEDLDHVGATIHMLEEKVDAGDILATIKADKNKKPFELFADLHDRAYALYLDTALKLYKNMPVEPKKQDISLGKNYLLKDWTHEVRYKLGKKIISWSKNGKLSLVSKSNSFYIVVSCLFEYAPSFF
jgi:folate-dependent phosphoribosylglycinamide formyltransferase PurN